MKFFTLLIFFYSTLCHAQKLTVKNAEDILVSKNFNLIAAIEKEPLLRKALPSALKNIAEVKNGIFSPKQIQTLDSLLLAVYEQEQVAVDKLLDIEIRPSGNYILFHRLDNKHLWLKCWAMYYRGINQIVNVYGLSKKGRYPDVDSMSYDLKSSEYQNLLGNLITKTRQTSGVSFYEQPLKLAIGLLLLNKRNETSLFEPLDQNENKKARQQVKKTDFTRYPYTAVLIPGEGPEDDQPLAEAGKKRCDLAALSYQENKVPFLIVSGGNVHPFHTRFNEAWEMKKYLMEKYKIPASAIIMDPHARHTTTNFRNAGRYLINFGFPMDRPALCLTDKEQADYIIDPRFGNRNQNELGFVPYRGLKRISDMEIEFFTVHDVLFRDPIDPLDP